MLKRICFKFRKTEAEETDLHSKISHFIFKLLYFHPIYPEFLLDFLDSSPYTITEIKTKTKELPLPTNKMPRIILAHSRQTGNTYVD